MNPPLIKVESDSLLLVEGKTAEVFFRAMLERLGKRETQVINFGGIAELRGNFQRVAQDPKFLAQGRTLAIIRDAETNARAAFDSVLNAVRSVGLTASDQPGHWHDAQPAVGVYVLPDNTSPGTLESLCLSAATEDATGKARGTCMNDFLACLTKASGTATGVSSDKTKMQSLLAGAGVQNPQVGAAARANYFDWTAPAFAKLSAFLEKL